MQGQKSGCGSERAPLTPTALSPGEPQQLQVRFLRAEGYPVDLYYLMDLSYSMKDDLEFVRQLGHALLVRLQEVTQSVRIGERSPTTCQPLPLISTASLASANVLDTQGPHLPSPSFNRPQVADIFLQRHASSRSELEGI